LHAAWWIELLRALERGGVTLATIADDHRLVDRRA